MFLKKNNKFPPLDVLSQQYDGDIYLKELC